MKILLLILGLFFSGGVFAEPSDWVNKELISKPITYMTYGLNKCTENFANVSAAAYSPICSYDWEENRLIFATTEVESEQLLSATDMDEAVKYCKSKINIVLKMFTEGKDIFLITLYLNGFMPDGYSYASDPNRSDKLKEFVQRSLIRIQTVHEESLNDGTVWICEWKYNQPEPSIRKGKAF